MHVLSRAENWVKLLFNLANILTINNNNNNNLVYRLN